VEIERSVRLIVAVVLLMVILGILIKEVLERAEFFTTMSGMRVELTGAITNAKKLEEVGCLGNKEVCPSAMLLLQTVRACEESAVECATMDTILITPEKIKELLEVKVDTKALLFVENVKLTTEMWKVYGGFESEECTGECVRGFYMAFEESSIPVDMTPFKLAKTLYLNRDYVRNLCDGSLDNCPQTKTCITCYEIYQKYAVEQKDVQKALVEMRKLNCDDACFAVAKGISISLESKMPILLQ